MERPWRSATAFVPGDDEDAVRLEIPGLAVAVASPQHLLAMKMAAFRPTDMANLELLFGQLGISTAGEAADTALDVYGENTAVLPHRDELILSAQAIVDRLGRRKSAPGRAAQSGSADAEKGRPGQ